METLMECYARHLTAAVADPKNGYHYGPDKVAEVAERMCVAAKSGGAHISGPAWAATCKELKIKKSAKAVKDFIANHK